jgi:ABC-2 type transport system permease protein
MRYWITFSTLLNKEVMRFSRIWVQTVLPSAITTTLYFVIFGRLIGERIGVMGGFDYMDFIVPGLVLMAVITNSYSNVVSSFYSSKFSRYVEELLVSPAPSLGDPGGLCGRRRRRGLAVGAGGHGGGHAVHGYQPHSYPVTLLVFVLTAVLFALGGFINAVFANSFDDISIVPTFVLTPLTYLGGVFYSIDCCPSSGRPSLWPTRCCTWSTPSATACWASATFRCSWPSASSLASSPCFGWSA